MMNKDDIALFEKQKETNNQLNLDCDCLKSELAESGKNLYEQKELLKMCRNEKQELRNRIAKLEQITTVHDLWEKQLKDANKVIKDGTFIPLSDSSGNTYWPFYNAGDESLGYIFKAISSFSSWAFASITVICVTVYKIAQMIGF